MRSSILISALTAAAFALPSMAQAQDYPTRTIKALTTTSAGGISDIFMRALGDELNKRWGQPIIVENRPGGMQNLGARACTEAPPDGYTICILNAEPVAYNQFLLKSMPFDPEKGLQPITNLYHLIQTLVVNASLKVKTIDELIALSKAKPGTLNYVTASVPLAFYMETLVKEKGADWVRVPFKGGGEAVNAVLGGSTPIALIGEGNVIGQIRAGTMTPLVMLNNIRSPNFPEVPTAGRDRLQGRAVAQLVRPVRARRHAEADRRQDRQGRREHRERSGLPRAASHRPQPGSGDQHAGAVRRGDQARPRRRRARGQRGGPHAAMTIRHPAGA